ncbi:MAG: energy transducer TonB [Pseudomonadota bacterium]
MRNRFLGMNCSKFCMAALLMVLCFAMNTSMAADGLTDEQERALFINRTKPDQPSAELMAALEIHTYGARNAKRSTHQKAAEAALAALNKLSPNAPKNDFDRAWVVEQKALALQYLNKTSEASAAYEQLLNVPHSKAQEWLAQMYLSALKNGQDTKACGESGGLMPSSILPAYPPTALRNGIEGWVDLLLDIAPDGTILDTMVHSSSLKAFEKPAMDWVVKQKWQVAPNELKGQRCIRMQPVIFELGSKAAPAKYPLDKFPRDLLPYYYDTGAATRVYEAANAEMLAEEAAEKSAGAVPAN